MQIDGGDVAFQLHNLLVVRHIIPSAAYLSRHPLQRLRVVFLHGIDEPLREIRSPSDVVAAPAPFEIFSGGLLRRTSARTVLKAAVGTSTCHSVRETGSAHGVYIGLFPGRCEDTKKRGAE